MSNSSEAVKRWRNNTKKRIINSMGGSCRVCNYGRCDAALELHHLDPSKKDLSFGGARANPLSWEKLVVELRKCILLCAICHREFHDGMITLPTAPNGSWFDETYADYKLFEAQQKLSPCEVCGKLKASFNKTCSRNCSAKKSRTVDWDLIDLLTLRKTNNYSDIGRMLGISGAAVRKREKKLLK